METRPLGRTGLELPVLSFGASSLGAEFRPVGPDEAIAAVHAALDCGLNCLDTSPYYGRGISEVLLGFALRGLPREELILCTKAGRYGVDRFDFRAARLMESVEVSLHRLGTDYLDILLLHDVEFVPLEQIWQETLPAAARLKEQGKVRAIGFSCHPMATFHRVLDEFPVDCVLSYNQHTLQDTSFTDDLVPRLEAEGIGAMNAGPFAARLLSSAPLPAWHGASAEVRAAAAQAVELCRARGVDLAQLALQFSCSDPRLATTVAGSANPANIRQWAGWLAQPLDQDLLAEVQGVFAPVKNQHPQVGLAENN